MTIGELSGVIGLVVSLVGIGAVWGTHRAQAAAHAKDIADLKNGVAGMGRRIGGLKTAIAILAAKEDTLDRLAPYLDGGTKRQTAARGIQVLTEDTAEFPPVIE